MRIPQGWRNAGTHVYKLLKPVYGTPDAPRRYQQAIFNDFKKEGLRQSLYDPSVFYLKNSTDTLEGVKGMIIDDSIVGGVTQWKRWMKTSEKFGNTEL